MAPLLFDDEDVRARLDAGTAVDAIRSALLAHHRRALQAPARVRADLGDTRLVFTAGAVRDPGVFGAVLAGAAVARSGADQVTVFCSVGLAGTEVAVAAALLPAAR